MKNPEEYISESEFIPELKVDIAFIVRTDFYYGDENDFTEEEWKTQRELLYKPQAELFDTFYALSEELGDNMLQLVKYYLSVIDVAKRYNKILAAGSSYFWIRPLVFKKGIDTITFPWYDTLADALPFFTAIQSSEEGCVFDDMDQGWHLVVYTENEKIHFVFGSLEEPEPYWVVSSNRFAIAQMAAYTLKRMEKEIVFLAKQTGKDYWTKRENN